MIHQYQPLAKLVSPNNTPRNDVMNRNDHQN